MLRYLPALGVPWKIHGFGLDTLELNRTVVGDGRGSEHATYHCFLISIVEKKPQFITRERRKRKCKKSKTHDREFIIFVYELCYGEKTHHNLWGKRCFKVNMKDSTCSSSVAMKIGTKKKQGIKLRCVMCDVGVFIYQHYVHLYEIGKQKFYCPREI